MIDRITRVPHNQRMRQSGSIILLILFGCVGDKPLYLKTREPAPEPPPVVRQQYPVSKSDLTAAFLNQTQVKLPQQVKLQIDEKPNLVSLEYTFDSELQAYIEKLFKQYHPDFGAFVALDAVTGKILTLVSYGRDQLTQKASYPAASVFKVVTAAAAIEGKKLTASSLMPVSGRSHTLYKSQVLTPPRWARFRLMTLKEAFASSVNPFFGKLGAYTVGAQGLKEYATRFGFGRKIEFEFPLETGRAWIPEDAYGLAETASGFTRLNTMSPIQGALIAAAIVNGGKMMEPYAIQSATDEGGKKVYEAESHLSSVSVDPQTAIEIRELMRQTISRGTSRKSFRGFFRGTRSTLDVGGKTGSLQGGDPQGKHDWFVGYADGAGQKIAVGVLTIHGKYWRVKSSMLARMAFEKYFSGKLRLTARN